MAKYYSFFKFPLLIKFFLIYFIVFVNVASCDQSGQKENLNTQNNLIALGSNKAPVKIKIFSSLTCPHCASFHIEVVPKIKKEYVDTGKVQIIFIDFPLDQASFNASKLLHCSDQKKQMSFLDTIYETQAKWTIGSTIDEINENLKKIVKNLGINTNKFNKCLIDEVISDKILNGRINANEKYSINSTPTIIINEKKFKGSTDFKNIKKNIEKLI